MLALKTICSKLEGGGVGVMVPTLDIRADERKTQIRRRKENFLAWGSINSTPLSSLRARCRISQPFKSSFTKLEITQK